MSFERVILIIIDACGVGELPDADQYGDIGAATIPNVARAVGGLNMPACQSLGLGNIVPINGVPPQTSPTGSYGKMAQQSAGKDSTSGHWEIGGVILDKPFPLFPDGFPSDLVRRFEKSAQVRTIGNIPASGTEIIKQLGERHLRTGEIILYTSADSVFQLAAHEEIIPIDRLYEMCRIAREMLVDEYGVGRVIARPFIGHPDEFVRTSRRRDFSRLPPSDTILDLMTKNDLRTLAVGKIHDLYAGRGLSHRLKASDNSEVMDTIITAVKHDSRHRLIFGNCVDFDMLWGHRNDERAFADGLEQFDCRLAELLPVLREKDLLMITADHGCDPTIKSSTDHTREYVPLLVYGAETEPGVNLGTRRTFSDIASTLADNFKLRHRFPGRSFLKQVRKSG